MGRAWRRSHSGLAYSLDGGLGPRTVPRLRSRPLAGLALSDSRMILSGAIPAAALAFAVDGALGVLQRIVTPTGLEIAG